MARDPDWNKIREIGREASQLREAAGALTPGDYERLLTEAKTAVGDHPELLEFLVNFDPSGGPDA